MAMKRKKKTPEERAAERAYREDLTRRLLETIERYKALIAEKRAARRRRLSTERYFTQSWLSRTPHCGLYW